MLFGYRRKARLRARAGVCANGLQGPLCLGSVSALAGHEVSARAAQERPQR